MAWQHTIYAYPMLFSTAVSLGLAAYAIYSRRRSDREQMLVVFAVLCLAVAVWTGFSALKLVSTNPDVKMLAYQFLHVGSSATAPLLLLFALVYTDRRHWLRPGVVAALFAVPAVYVAILVTNPYDLAVTDRTIIDVGGVVVQRTETGPAHVALSAIYTRVLGLATLGIVLYELYRQGRSYLPQATLLAVAILTPVTVGLLTEAGVPPFHHETVNLVPASTAVSIGAIGVAIGRYELLDLPPIAYRTAIRDSPDGVLALDRDGRVAHANPSASSILDGSGSLRGATLEDVLPGFDPVDGAAEVVELPMGAGEPRSLDVRSQSLERRGERVGWVLVLRDVTERRRRERELETFTGVISHDLRQPLRATEQYLELLSEHAGDELDEEGRELLEEARRNSSRARAMISDLRDYSRIERGAEESFEPVDTEALVSEVVDAHQFEIEDRDATVVVQELPTVHGSEPLLRRLFQNLLSNALEHGGDSPEIRIGAMRGEGRWNVAISDDGPGIDPAEREHAFEPFTRGADAESDGGTGMGLAICERIVEAHGGSIEIDSTPGGGTTVTFTLAAEPDD